MKSSLHLRLVLGGYKTSTFSHTLARILKVYTEDLPGFSHIHSPDVLNNTLLFQGCVLEIAPSVGTVGGIFQECGKG